MQKRLSASPASHLVPCVQHAVGQQFVSGYYLCQFYKVPIWPFIGHKCRLLHVFIACNPLPCNCFAIHQPLHASNLDRRLCPFPQKSPAWSISQNTHNFHAALLISIFRNGFSQIEKRCIEYVQCEYRQWWILLKVFDGNALKLVN